MVKLMEMGGRPVTLLDGDVVRKHLSSELGFSKEHRDLNIKRIGYVASEITKNGGIAICAPIAPYTATRRAVREMIEAFGAFIETHVATSRSRNANAATARGSTSWPAKARSRNSQVFQTLMRFREPRAAVETENVDVDNCAHQVILKLEQHGADQGLIAHHRTGKSRAPGRGLLRFCSRRHHPAYRPVSPRGMRPPAFRALTLAHVTRIACLCVRIISPASARLSAELAGF